jgi:sugar lactone lactonase YvrE
VFTRTGLQIGKLTATYQVEQGEPHGCAIDQAGRLFTSSVGNVGFGSPQGQLIVWFPPFDVYSSANAGGSRRRAGSAEARARAKASDNFCKLATDIGTAGSVAIDGEGRVYVSSSGRGAIYRFSPPFPTGANADGGCGAIGPLGSPMASQVQREVFFDGLYTFSGLAFATNGHLYAASVFTGEILEIAPDGTLIRKLLEPDGLLPPFETGNPMSLAIDSRGSLYYADLDLAWDFPSIGPGPDGKVRRIRFDAAGDPLAPEILADGLGFPDGVSIAPSLTTSGR